MAQGLFDLATPQSALELASFVLALGYQFDVLRHALPSKHLHSIKWRSDSDTVSWAESIHDWCISLDTSNQSRYVRNMMLSPCDLKIYKFRAYAVVQIARTDSHLSPPHPILSSSTCLASQRTTPLDSLIRRTVHYPQLSKPLIDTRLLPH